MRSEPASGVGWDSTAGRTATGLIAAAAVLALTGVGYGLARAHRRRSPIPRERAIDSTWSLLNEGYTFISSRCQRLGSDIFATRLMLRPVICMMGEEAARVFYEPGRLTRRQAMPTTTTMLLQDFGSVQLLEDEAHRRRKRMFLSFTMDPAQIQRVVAAFEHEWGVQLRRWEASPRIVLHQEAREILCRAVCAWAGVPLSNAEAEQRTREFAAMLDASGTALRRKPIALFLRNRNERWMQDVIRGIRSGDIEASEPTPAHTIAWHREPDGRLLDSQSAAVELINVLRPAVAVGRFVTLAALALHDHPECRRRLAGDDEYLEMFVQEVRRFYPFFPAIGGRVRKPFEWRSHEFAEGAWVLLDLYGTNHDPRSWEAPALFRPERFQRWRDNGFSLIPQGGGDTLQSHRCPGEAITIALMKSAVRMLTERIAYDVPPQDLRLDMRTVPAIPASRFVMTNVARC